MNLDNLKKAFGSTPESVKECVRRSLREEKRREQVMKRKMTVSIAAALAVIMMLGCAGFAASQLDGIAGIFGYTDPETGEVVVNEAAIAQITALNEVYEGKTVRFTLTEGMYTPLTEQVAMSWTLETVDPEAEYYILCNAQVGGSWIEAGSLMNMTEYFLKGAKQDTRSGVLTGDGLMAELKFSILKVNGEIVRYSYVEDEASSEERKQTRKEYLEECISEGKLPMAGDGMIEVPGIPDATYAEELVATGLVELAEEFTVTFDLGAISPGEAYRVYEGEKQFAFDGFEIHFNEVVVTPTGSRIEYDYISDTEITQDDMDFLMASPNASVEGVDVWTKSAGATNTDPVQMEDGRWKITVSYRTYAQTVYPEELIFSLTRYDENGDPTPLTGEGIRLTLTDK